MSPVTTPPVSSLYLTFAGSEFFPEHDAEHDEGVFNGTSSITTSTFNLAKNIIGGGMLALSAGMAAGDGTGYVPAIALMLITGLLNAYTFLLVGQSVQYTKATNFKDLWSKTIGPKSAWIVDTAIFALCLGICIVYGCFLGDIFSSLASIVPWIPSILALRSVAILSITGFILLPLCLLKDLSALRFSSIVGICAVFYITAFIVKRCFDGTYAIGSGLYLEGLDQEFQPKPTTGGLFSAGAGTFVLFNMLSTAYTCHFNAVKFYIELERATPARFSLVVFSAFSLSAAVYGVVMACGYATFGQAASGLILNNYGKSDELAILGRLATGISIIASQPLLFNGVRDAAFSIFATLKLIPEDMKLGPAQWIILSVALLSIPTAVAIATPNVGAVVSLEGSLLAAGISYSLPALISLNVRQQPKLGTSFLGCGRTFLLCLILLFGIIMTFVGTGLSLIEM